MKLGQERNLLEICPLNKRDIDQVLSINADNPDALAKLDETEFLRILKLSNTHRAAFVKNGRLLGYMLSIASDVAYDGEEFRLFQKTIAKPFLYVDQIAIALDAKGSGVGRTLYDALDEQAATLGISVICCEVNITPPNPASLAFHSKLGFQRKDFLRTVDGRDVALLTKVR